jgi:hypothetical protein
MKLKFISFPKNSMKLICFIKENNFNFFSILPCVKLSHDDESMMKESEKILRNSDFLIWGCILYYELK